MGKFGVGEIDISSDEIIDEKPRNGDSVTREEVEGIINIEDPKIGDDIKEEDEEVLKNAMGDIVLECAAANCKFGPGETVWKTDSLPANVAALMLTSHTEYHKQLFDKITVWEDQDTMEQGGEVGHDRHGV